MGRTTWLNANNSQYPSAPGHGFTGITAWEGGKKGRAGAVGALMNQGSSLIQLHASEVH